LAAHRFAPAVGVVVGLLDQKPRLVLALAEAGEGEAAVQLLAVQSERQMPAL
jgi:hypothetical protein